MKLTELLENLGRAVSYYPELTKITGGVAETLLLCQLLYWHGKQEDVEGWIYKTQDELLDETGLSRREQETARRNLKSKGLLEEDRRGVPAKLYYRPNVDALNKAWAVLVTNKDGGKRHSRMAESAIQESANPPDRDGAISQPRMAEPAELESANPPDKSGGTRHSSKEHKTTHEITSLEIPVGASPPADADSESQSGSEWNAGQVLAEVINEGETILGDIKARLGRELKRIARDRVPFEIACKATRRCIDEHKSPTALPLIVQELIDGRPRRSANGHQAYQNAPQYSGEIR